MFPAAEVARCAQNETGASDRHKRLSPAMASSFATRAVGRAANLSKLVITNRTRATALVPKPYTQQKVFSGASNKAAGAKPPPAAEFTRPAAKTGKKGGAPRGMNFGWARGASVVKSTGGVPARHL